MIRSKKIVALAALVLTTAGTLGTVALVTPAVFAQNNDAPTDTSASKRRTRPDRTTPRADSPDQMARTLNLTPDQVTRSQALRQQYEAQTNPLEQQLRQARQELQALFASSTATEAQIRQKQQDVQQLDQQVDTLRFNGRLAFWQILTTEQRQLLAQRKPSPRTGTSSRPVTPRL